MITIEQVEILREKAHVSYDEAKAALEATNGDLLDAVIHLERQGKIPPTGGFYSGEKAPEAAPVQTNERSQRRTRETFGGLLSRLGKALMHLLRKGNINTFEILRHEESKAVFPVTVLALLVIFMFPPTAFFLILGMFFGFRYRFNGPDLGKSAVNDPMEQVAEAAEELKNNITIKE
jgi:hypothetical protein